jgi:hypothetical protein
MGVQCGADEGLVQASEEHEVKFVPTGELAGARIMQGIGLGWKCREEFRNFWD